MAFSSTFSLVTNTSELSSRFQSVATRTLLSRSFSRLSSGLRLGQSQADPAGLAIADSLKGQIKTLSQSINNLNDGIGFLQTADSAYERTQGLLNRAATLLAQAASFTNEDQLPQIENELREVFQEVDTIGRRTNFAGVHVFDGSNRHIFAGDTKIALTSAATIQVAFSQVTSSVLGLTSGISGAGPSLSVDLDNAVSGRRATDLLVQVEVAIDAVAQRRGTLGAKINRLENSRQVISVQLENLTAAESQIRDTNFAEESATLARLQILSESGLASLAQSQSLSRNIVNLFQ